MLGAAFGGLLLDHISAAATLIGGTVLLVLASLTIGRGERIEAPVLNVDSAASDDKNWQACPDSAACLGESGD
jgi:hypothetical protein